MKMATQVGEPQRDGEVWLVPSASGGAVYTVYEHWSGRLACDCPDFWYRKRRAGGVCNTWLPCWRWNRRRRMRAGLSGEAEPLGLT